jgi:hypothetical protein
MTNDKFAMTNSFPAEQGIGYLNTETNDDTQYLKS